MHGFADRIKYELATSLQRYEQHPDQHPPSTLRITVSLNHANDAWQGGAIPACIDSYLPLLSLSKAEYEESGETALIQKFEAANVLF